MTVVCSETRLYEQKSDVGVTQGTATAFILACLHDVQNAQVKVLL